MKVHSTITTFLVGAVVTLTIYSGLKFRDMQEQQKDIMLLQETVIGMSQMVIVQGIQIESLKEKIAKFSGTRVTY